MIAYRKMRGLIFAFWLLSMSRMTMCMEKENAVLRQEMEKKVQALKQDDTTLKQEFEKNQQLLEQRMAKLIALKERALDEDKRLALMYSDPGAIKRLQEEGCWVGNLFI